MKIYLENKTNYIIDHNMINILAFACEIYENINYKLSMNLTICNNEEIKKYNYLYRNINKETDVLSFPTLSYLKGYTFNKINNLKSIYDPEDKTYFIGDCIISYEKVIKQSEEYNHSIEREFLFLIAHSILHLFGYDHIEEGDEKIMKEAQNNILDSINVSRDESNGICDSTLIDIAIKSLEFSYSPYSKFPVAAALLSKDGRIYTGVNIENAAFGSTMCAERTAVFKAVSEGCTDFETIVIAGKGIKPYPCGSCRQVLNEFCDDIKIIVTDDKKNYDITSLNELLPCSFGPKQMR